MTRVSISVIPTHWRHPGAGRDPVAVRLDRALRYWVPACAGMTPVGWRYGANACFMGREPR